MQARNAVRVITLDNQIPTVINLLESLKAQGVNATFFAAVDGRHGSPELHDGEFLDQQKSIDTRMVALTGGEIGCYLSHLRAIQQAWNEGLTHLCLLEDDTEIEPDFADVLEKLFALPDDYEFVRLMGLKLHKRKVVMDLNRHRLVRPIKGLCGTQGYVVNRRGMEKIIRQGSHIYKPIDKFYDHFWEIDLKAFCVEPHLIWERPSTSNIKKESRRVAASTVGKKWLSQILKLKRSFKRRVYITTRFFGFFPNSKPPREIGKTARIR